VKFTYRFFPTLWVFLAAFMAARMRLPEPTAFFPAPSFFSAFVSGSSADDSDIVASSRDDAVAD
jgi:hypothetical protein